MLFQLGDKIYSGLFAPHTMAHAGNEATYAELPIINGKPRIQLTGNSLEQITISIQLRAEYCVPSDEIKNLQEWKTNGTILPIVYGNGDYLNDYVIVAISYNIEQALSDGTAVEINAEIGLVEYVVSSPAEAQAKEDRRKALAVGDKQQVSRMPAQPKTPEAEAHNALVVAQNEAWEVMNVAQAAVSTDTPESFTDKIAKSVGKAQAAMNNARQKVDDAQEQITNATGIVSSVENTAEKLNELNNIFEPPITANSITAGILNMQTSLRFLSGSTLQLTKDVILRR